MKRNLMLLLAVLMLIVAPTMLLRAEAATIVDSGTCGENLTWTLDSKGKLTISGNGDMEDYGDGSYWYDADEAPWYSQRNSIVSIVVEEGVTTIGRYAFYNCGSLSSITIPDSVTSIGESAFMYCASLSSITIPDSVTSIGESAFMYCASLSSITIPDSITSICDFAFYDCDSLSSITIPDSVTTIGYGAFYDCDSLSSITIPDSVTSIGDWAFAYCDSLSSVVIGNGVTTIGNYAFYDCDSLSSITIPDSVTTIGSYAFQYCYSLSKVEITDIAAWCQISFGNNDSNPLYYADNGLYLNGEPIMNVVLPESVTSIPVYAFAHCASLSSITIPDSVTSIGDSAFYNCNSLSSITIPDSVTSIGDWAFYSCDSLAVVHYGGTKAQSANITIEDFNWALEDAIWHYECDGTECPELPLSPDNPFGDVAQDAYYFDPVLWAVENGITNGLSADSFGPDATCTRGQIVTFLWRANGSPEPKMVFNPFSDVSSEDYFYDAVLWAVENGITGGMGDGTFAPGAPCTRGQVATFLWRAEGQPYSYGENIFSDISHGAYYYDAVLWAVENGITNGMGEGIFAPDATCTRGQIVTFLYRAM